MRCGSLIGACVKQVSKASVLCFSLGSVDGDVEIT